jgi:hypothetical protein
MRNFQQLRFRSRYRDWLLRGRPRDRISSLHIIQADSAPHPTPYLMGSVEKFRLLAILAVDATMTNILNRGISREALKYFQQLSFCFVVAVYRPPLWCSGQSSWLQFQRFRFDCRRYQIFRELMGLVRGPLSIVSTIEELLERKGNGSGPENREYGSRDPSR